MRHLQSGLQFQGCGQLEKVLELQKLETQIAMIYDFIYCLFDSGIKRGQKVAENHVKTAIKTEETGAKND